MIVYFPQTKMKDSARVSDCDKRLGSKTPGDGIPEIFGVRRSKQSSR